MHDTRDRCMTFILKQWERQASSSNSQLAYILTDFVVFRSTPPPQYSIWEKRNERPKVEGAFIDSRSGATSRIGCVFNGQMIRQTVNEYVPPPSRYAWSMNK